MAKPAAGKAGNGAGGGAAGRARPKRACPVCRRPAAEDAYPFCSPRCADVDLHRWLAGAYRIPAGPEEDEVDGDGTGSGMPVPDSNG